jgi:hypothetical protein
VHAQDCTAPSHARADITIIGPVRGAGVVDAGGCDNQYKIRVKGTPNPYEGFGTQHNKVDVEGEIQPSNQAEPNATRR